jgi:hypothetical protein
VKSRKQRTAIRASLFRIAGAIAAFLSSRLAVQQYGVYKVGH